MPKIIFCLVLMAAFTHSINAQTATALIRELLDLPSAPARTSDPDGRPESFFKTPPPDDAPIEDLLIYWNRKTLGNYSVNEQSPTASVKTSLRLIDAVEAEPGQFISFLKILPVEKEITDRVKLLYDVKLAATDVSDDWRNEVKEWLKFNSGFFVEDLLASAQTARDHKEYSAVLRSRELQRLAELDWERAAPILERLAADKANPRTAVFAKRLFYEHTLREKNTDQAAEYRDELKKIVENRSATGSERALAFDALTDDPSWPGFDDWYLSLFADETLLELRLTDSSITAPLVWVTDRNPGKWTPILAGLVGHKNANVHNAAVNCLVEIAENEPSRAAMLPLLPWLTNPDWAKDTGTDRRDFIRRLAKVEMPESVLGLIWLVENEDDDDAAYTLAAFKEQRAVPALLGALSRTPDERTRESFIKALIACGGFSDEEMIGAIQTYVETILTPQGYERVEKHDEWADEDALPIEISLGKFFAKQEKPSESFVRAVFERIAKLEKAKPAVANKLLEIANRWRGKAADAELIKRVADGRADIDAIVTVLSRRKELRETVPLELSWLTAKSGLPLAIGVGVFEDETQMAGLVFQNQPETQIAALGCARLLRIKLPVREVGRFLESSDKLLALAAERYLESEDSREARDLVLSRHAGEAKILGARDCFYPNGSADLSRKYSKEFLSSLGCSLSVYYADNFAEFDRHEEGLRREILEDNDLVEIYASGETVLRVFREKSILTWGHDSAISYEKILTKEDLAAFHKRIEDYKIDEKNPEFKQPGFVTGMSQFVMIDRRGGRRVFAYGGMGIALWRWFLFEPLKRGDAKLQFKFARHIAGLEILLQDSRFTMTSIWKNGSDVRILVENDEREHQISDEIDKLDKLDEENDDLDYKTRQSNARKRRAEREFEHFEWRKFENGQLAERISEPVEIPFLRDNLTFPSVEDLDSSDGVRNSRSGNYDIRAGGNFDTYGLWKVNRGERIRISNGWAKNPVTTPDGKWVIASQTDTNWENPNYLVRINLTTGKESRIKIAPARNLKAIAFISAHQKMLLRSADDSAGYNNAKHYLLNVATGTVTPVTGVFRPLGHQTHRVLQPTGRPDESWAAIYDGEATEIGVYNERTFSFKSWVRLPEIALDSMDIWVDEQNGKVYFVYTEQSGGPGFLLSVPLEADRKSSGP